MPAENSPKYYALIRHGETDWNARNVFQGRVDRPLNLTGRRQAAEAGAFVSEWGWGRLVASPLTRAQQTASLVNERLGLERVSTIDSLVERDFGEAEGMDRHDALERWGHDAIPGAETMYSVAVRAAGAWSDVLRYGVSTVLVSHVVIIRTIVQMVVGVNLAHVPNGGVIILRRDGSDWAMAAQFPAPVFSLDGFHEAKGGLQDLA